MKVAALSALRLDNSEDDKPQLPLRVWFVRREN